MNTGRMVTLVACTLAIGTLAHPAAAALIGCTLIACAVLYICSPVKLAYGTAVHLCSEQAITPVTEFLYTGQATTEQMYTEHLDTVQVFTDAVVQVTDTPVQVDACTPLTEAPVQPSTEQPSTVRLSTRRARTAKPVQPSTDQASTVRLSTEQPSTDQASTVRALRDTPVNGRTLSWVEVAKRTGVTVYTAKKLYNSTPVKSAAAI